MNVWLQVAGFLLTLGFSLLVIDVTGGRRKE